MMNTKYLTAFFGGNWIKNVDFIPQLNVLFELHNSFYNINALKFL